MKGRGKGRGYGYEKGYSDWQARGNEWKGGGGTKQTWSWHDDQHQYYQAADKYETYYTTVMLGNLPPKLTAEQLLAQIDYFYPGKFDFLYLPVCFETGLNTGHAFINFRKPRTALDCKTEFHGFSDWGLKDEESVACWTNWAKVQGKDANVEKQKKSSLIAENIPEDYKPWVFDDHGKRVPTVKLLTPIATRFQKKALDDSQEAWAFANSKDWSQTDKEDWGEDWHGGESSTFNTSQHSGKGKERKGEPKRQVLYKEDWDDSWEIDEKWPEEDEWTTWQSSASKAQRPGKASFKGGKGAQRWQQLEGLSEEHYEEYRTSVKTTDKSSWEPTPRGPLLALPRMKAEHEERQTEHSANFADEDGHARNETGSTMATMNDVPQELKPKPLEAVKTIIAQRYACPACKRTFPKWSACQAHVLSVCRTEVQTELGDVQLQPDLDELRQRCMEVADEVHREHAPAPKYLLTEEFLGHLQ